MYLMGGSIAGRRRLKTGPSATFHRGQPYPMEGVMDVPSGTVSARPKSMHGRRHEHQGGSRVFGLHRDTVRKMLAHSVPPGYRRRKPPTRPKIGPYTGVIDRILEDDPVSSTGQALNLPKKQRHTAKRIHERLRDEYGFDGGYTIVKDYVRKHRRRTREMFVPLVHPPGHAQCDFGEAWAVIGGVKQKIHFFVLDLPHSDAMFVRAYPAETTEAFCDGVRLGILLPGRSSSEHRLRQHQACGGEDTGRRSQTAHQDCFTELVSHYLFEDRFGRPGKGNDKGKVEGMVGYTRRNFLVPIPSFESFDSLNSHLEERCLKRIEARLRGHTETIGERMERDLDALLPLPAVCEYVERRENVIAMGNSGTGKTHMALGLGLAACQRGLSVGFTTAAALVNELMEARDERRLLNFQKRLSRLKLLIIDELGFVPLSKTGAELLFEVFSQRYERGSVLVTTNLPFDEWTEVFGSERLTGALLDRLTHHVHIIEMNGESYRLKESRQTAAMLSSD